VKGHFAPAHAAEEFSAVGWGEVKAQGGQPGCPDALQHEMPLHDRKGELIGALGVVVAYKQGDDKQALFKRADEVRVALEKHIPDSESLFKAGAASQDGKKKS
jgi:hypothetical protein